MAVTSAHVQVALLGLLICPIGVWWLRHPVRLDGDDEWTRRLNQVHRMGAVVIGAGLAVGGAVLVLGAVIGAILWGDHGDPRWPW